MSHDYRVNITYKGRDYQFELSEEAPNKASSLEGNSYSLHMTPQNPELTAQLLAQMQLPTSITIEDVIRNFTHIPHVEDVHVATISKTNEVALARLSPSELRVDVATRKSAVETSIMPPIPLRPGVPMESVSIEQRMKELGVPGASIAVINNGEIEWSSGYGELKDSNKLLQAASISKTAAALTVLSLIDQCNQAVLEGRPSGLKDDKIITLDTKVNTLLDADLWRSINPSGSEAGNEMTIRHLLSHTAGTSVDGFDGYPNNEEDLPTVENVLLGKGNSKKVQIEKDKNPGMQYAYSGGGTTILQKIVMDLTSQSFEKAVQDRVFTKLGMEDSTYHPNESRVVSGYDSAGALIPGSCKRYPELAAAGLWTTPTDLAKMAIGIQRSLKGEPGGILSKDLAQKMIELQTEGQHNGLGVFVDGAYFMHSGGTEGFRSLMIGSSEGRGVAIMTNSNSGDGLCAEISNRIAEVYDWPDRNENKMVHFPSPLSSEEIKSIVESSPPDLLKWTARLGSYSFIEDGGEEAAIQTLSEKDGKIFIQGDQMPLQEVVPLTDAIGRVGIDIIRFVPDTGGGAEVLSLWGSDHTKMTFL